MKMINLLLFTGLCIASAVAVFVTAMVLYLLKEAKWESNLKRFTARDDGTVLDPYGFIIEKPSDLLKQLQGIEEEICQR